MNKNLILIGLVGLTAGLCLSAKGEEKNQEIAMARCSKDNGKRSCYVAPDATEDKVCQGAVAIERNGYKEQVKRTPSGKKKSAAQKVLEGY